MGITGENEGSDVSLQTLWTPLEAAHSGGWKAETSHGVREVQVGVLGSDETNGGGMMDIIRVLRVIEYTGPRDKVEGQVAQSINGPVNFANGVTIRAATIGQYPEVLSMAEPNERAMAMQGERG